jgi:hypothetical protein
MAELLDLPAELLLNIATRLRHHGPKSNTLESYRNLRQLALTCRQLLPIAQDALYNRAVAGKSNITSRGPTRIARLAHTLLERPDLATRVKTLHLKTVNGPPNHPDACVGGGIGCCCGWLEIVGLCKTLLETGTTTGGLALYDEAWMSRIKQRHEPDLAGIILLLTPAVRDPRIDFGVMDPFDELDPDLEHNPDLGHGAEIIDLEKHFDALPTRPGFAIEHVSGLSNLTKLFSTGWVPSSMLSLPKLKEAKLGLLNCAYYNVPGHL